MFDLIHIEVWGLLNVLNISSAHWFVTFIDDCTRATWVYLLKQKYEVYFVFHDFFSMVKNQFDVSIKRIRFDNAKDYCNHSLTYFYKKEGIIHESSCVKPLYKMGFLGEIMRTC